MEAEEPRHTASTSIPAIEEFIVIPEAIMRSSQIPALDPEAQEGQDPSYKWREEHRLSVTQPKELGDMSVYAAESMPSIPKEGPADVETRQGNMVTEARDTPEHLDEVPQSLADRRAEILAHSVCQTCPIEGKGVHVIPTSSELDSGVEVESGPELTPLTFGQAQGKEETTLGTFAQTRFWTPQEEPPTDCSPAEDSGSGTIWPGEEPRGCKPQESDGQEGLLIPWETQGPEGKKLQEREFPGRGILGENVCSDGLLGEQEQMIEQVNGKEGEQRQVQEQVEEDVMLGQGERGELIGALEGLSHGTWGQEERENRAQAQGSPEERRRESGQLEERRVDCQHMKNQSLVEESEEQVQNLKEKEMTKAAQEEEEKAGSSEEEPGNQDGGQLERVGESGSTEEEEERHGPSALAVADTELPSSCDLFPGVSCPMTQITRTHTEPGAEELSPRALTPTLEPIGRSPWSVSLPGSFPTEESLDNKVAHSSPQEGSELRKGTEVVSADTSVTPPRTPDVAPFSPAEVALIATAPASASPPKASLSADNPSHGAPETTLTALHASSAAASKDPSANSDGASLRGPLANCAGTVQHLRSNSFPGSHRTEQAPDLAGLSLSFSHLELPQRPPKPAIYGSVTPRRDRRSGRDRSVISESPTTSSISRQDSGEFTSHPEGPSGPHSSQPRGSSPSTVSRDMRVHEPLPPPPLEKKHIHASMVEGDGHLQPVVPMLKPFSHPPPLALSLGPPKGPLPQVPEPPVSRQHRPLPSTPDSSHHTQISFPTRLRYNKPLPPTPDLLQPHHSSISSSSLSRIYRPLPPVPIIDPSTEPPPLPPKSRGRSRSAQGGLLNSGAQAKPRPAAQDWTGSTAPSAGRTSWPPAMGRSTEALIPTNQSKSEVSPNMAFSNMLNFLGPSSPTTSWTLELQGPNTEDDPGLSAESDTPARGLLRRSAPPDGGQRKSALSSPRQPEKPSHPQLEKASSWPHRRDAGRPPEATSGLAVVPGEGSSKHKGWNRQGLRRPSILPEGSDSKGSTLGRSPGPSDAVVFREKKPKEGTSGFSRRCSKLINSSQLLYQEYSDVFLNKEIQSQQRLDSLAEVPGLASPRQPRKALVPSESYLQRLSVASSGSLWQEIPVVRNSTVLLSMTHEDQKLQEAKFELIVSEASYLRSLHIAVDHFQLSTQLRATLSNQEHQWLFSRLQDVRDVSTTFLSDLEENFENNIFSFQVCDVVLSHAPDFRRVYLPYVTNQTYQERTFQSLLNSNTSFREVLEKLESDPICQRLSLKSFLILPFQRITRLKLLLQNILKRTQPGSSEEAEATKAHHALEELIRDCNNNVQRMRRTEELIYLSQKIEFECKIFPLISQSRWLVKSGELMALEFSVSPGLRRKLNTRPVHLHLFNDCLLLSRPREGNRFLVFDHAPFSSIRGEKCEMKLHGAHKNLFRLFLRNNAQGTQAEFLFRTETQSEKLRWISALAMPRKELDLLECYDSPQVQCLRAYKPRENDELALEKADVVMVTQQSSDGWLEGVRLSDGEQGWFPMQQVEFISNPEVRARNLKEAHRVKTAKLQLVEQPA